MRLKKSIINSMIGMVAYLGAFLPIFIVRKVFLEVLGGELMGLTSLYTNIIGYLSIFEMGIGSAIIYSLYRPFSEGNKKKIIGHLNYYEKFYKKIGLIILSIGIIIMPFIHIFIQGEVDLVTVRLGFILFLINTILGYMFTYKHCILNVAQEIYKVSLGITISKILIAIFQVWVIRRYKSFYMYILIQIIINLIFYIVLNSYINRRFSWINNKNIKIEKEEEKNLFKNIKALFYHKIGGILVSGTDNIVVSALINLKTVAIYNNYMLIANAFSGLIGQIMNGITASIGNLLVEKDKKYAYKIHKRIFFINFWISSCVIIFLFNTISHFILLWLGHEYVLDKFTLALILFNLYFLMMRGQVEQFKTAAGEYYKDRFAPICEGMINLVSSLILINLIGLPGVFLGTLISNITVIFWTQPKIVYKYVFDEPIKDYFKRYFKYLSIGLITLIITATITYNIKMDITIKSFFLNCVVNLFLINIIYLIIFWKNENLIFIRKILLKFFRKSRNKYKEKIRV